MPRFRSVFRRKEKWASKYATLSKKMFKLYTNEAMDILEAIVDFDLLTCDLISDENLLEFR